MTVDSPRDSLGDYDPSGGRRLDLGTSRKEVDAVVSRHATALNCDDFLSEPFPHTIRSKSFVLVWPPRAKPVRSVTWPGSSGQQKKLG